jgi:hypothetical protein
VPQIGGVNVTYCLAEILLLGGFIKLRYSHADFYRPYAVPLDLMGCILLVLPPLSLCGAIFYYASLKVWMVVLPLLALGMLLYPIKCYIKQREWWAPRSSCTPRLYSISLPQMIMHTHTHAPLENGL